MTKPLQITKVVFVVTPQTGKMKRPNPDEPIRFVEMNNFCEGVAVDGVFYSFQKIWGKFGNNEHKYYGAIFADLQDSHGNELPTVNVAFNYNTGELEIKLVYTGPEHLCCKESITIIGGKFVHTTFPNYIGEQKQAFAELPAKLYLVNGKIQATPPQQFPPITETVHPEDRGMLQTSTYVQTRAGAKEISSNIGGVLQNWIEPSLSYYWGYKTLLDIYTANLKRHYGNEEDIFYFSNSPEKTILFLLIHAFELILKAKLVSKNRGVIHTDEFYGHDLFNLIQNNDCLQNNEVLKKLDKSLLGKLKHHYMSIGRYPIAKMTGNHSDFMWGGISADDVKALDKVYVEFLRTEFKIWHNMHFVGPNPTYGLDVAHRAAIIRRMDSFYKDKNPPK